MSERGELSSAFLRLVLLERACQSMAELEAGELDKPLWRVRPLAPVTEHMLY